ncbi:MAG: gamma-glutamylcyclotransferase [Burkholderiaceae bacterium]
MPDWLFAYGSLIWRPDFAYLERRRAVLADHVRQFWQGSHDHRGTPQAPGRVVTLVGEPGRRCAGMAYRLDPATREAVLDALDHREKNGYERRSVSLIDDSGELIEALVYLAPPGNFAWLGEADLAQLAAQVAASHGPSGANADYLRELVVALERLGADDDAHLIELDRQVQRIVRRRIEAGGT